MWLLQLLFRLVFNHNLTMGALVLADLMLTCDYVLFICFD